MKNIEFEARMRASWLSSAKTLKVLRDKVFIGFCCGGMGTPIHKKYKKASKLIQLQPNNWAYKKHYRQVCIEIAKSGPTFPKNKENMIIVRKIAVEFGLV